MTFPNEKTENEKYFDIFTPSPNPKKRLRSENNQLESTPLRKTPKHEINGPFCKPCSKEYPSDAHLQYHTWNSHTWYTCPVCKSDKLGITNARYHLCQDHGKTPTEAVELICPTKEPKTFIHPDTDSGTESEGPDEPEPLYCKLCDRFFQSKQGYSSHARNAHQTNMFGLLAMSKNIKDEPTASKSENSEIPSLPCSLCDRVFHTNSGLASHARSTHKTTRSEMLENVKVEQPDLPVPDISDSELSDTEIYDKKVGQKTWACPICAKVYMCQSGASSHVRKVHDMTFTQAKNMMTGAKKSYKYPPNNPLEDPSGEFGCTECPKRFATNWSRVTHIVRSHEKCRFECPFCTKTLRTLSGANDHVINMHGIPREEINGIITVVINEHGDRKVLE